MYFKVASYKPVRQKQSSSAKPLSRQEERLQKLMTLHPLTVDVNVKVPESDTAVMLTFSFLTKIKIVAVKVTLGLGKDLKGFSADQEVSKA